MISETTIQRVRDVSIEDVLKPYVNLTKRGNTLMGCCPFHSERTPSFSVSPSKNLYHCFGCGRGGDGIGFVMEKNNLSFSEAVEQIAKEQNIAIDYIEEERNDEEIAKSKHKESLMIVLDKVQKFFVDCLRLPIDTENKNARDYAFGRWRKSFVQKPVSAMRRKTVRRSWNIVGSQVLLKICCLNWACSNIVTMAVSMQCFANGL